MGRPNGMPFAGRVPLVGGAPEQPIAVVPCPTGPVHMTATPEGKLQVCQVCAGYGSVVVPLASLRRLELQHERPPVQAESAQEGETEAPSQKPAVETA